MKYLKTYEYQTLNYNGVYKFLKRIIKLIDKKYSVYLTNTNRINIYYSIDKDFTETISTITFQPNVLMFEIYNPKYEINKLLTEYFTLMMNKVYDNNYVYLFSYDSKTKLKLNDFKPLLIANKYNL